MHDVGGQNALTAIYLGYRVYDTLFEALLIVVSVVAASHMSWYPNVEVTDGLRSEIESSSMAKFTLRIICPIILLFGAYLALNGHISAGGGFQGGLAIAVFFICRYMVYNIYDIHIKTVMEIEKLIYINITVVATIAVFMGVLYLSAEAIPIWQSVYLIFMNIFIGLKVACGFFILFYRYIAIERLPAVNELEDYR